MRYNLARRCLPITAYAVYFDHKRQTDPEFRRALKRNNRRMARAVKEEAEAQGAIQRDTIKKAVQRAKDEGFPADLEEKEAYFMGQVAKGEGLCSEGMRLNDLDTVSMKDNECIDSVRPSRRKPHRSGSCLLQGPQGLPPA